MGLDSQGGLNSFQQRRLQTTFQYIDKLLADIETTLETKDSCRPFFPYVADIAPEQRSAVVAFTAQLRAKMLTFLAEVGIGLEPPQIPASRAIHTALTYIDIALQELRPKYMSGYGPVTETAAETLNQLIDELEPVVRAVDRVVYANRDERERRKRDS
jgi:hypothetical protein